IVFASLVGIAEDHIVNGFPIDALQFGHERPQGHGAEIVGTHGGKAPAKAADGRSAIGADVSFPAHAASRFPEWAAFVRACRSRRVPNSSSVGTGVSSTLSA